MKLEIRPTSRGPSKTSSQIVAFSALKASSSAFRDHTRGRARTRTEQKAYAESTSLTSRKTAENGKEYERANRPLVRESTPGAALCPVDCALDDDSSLLTLGEFTIRAELIVLFTREPGSDEASEELSAPDPSSPENACEEALVL
jgi:hypothetical protein